MAFYADEEDVWKCSDHPSRRRCIGVCPSCLREKLSVLCPDCATARPCACSSTASSSSSSLVSFPGDAAFSRSTGGSVARLSNFIDGEPSFRRSRSVAFPFFKSVRLSSAESVDRAAIGKSRSSFWLFFWPKRGKIKEEDAAVDLNIPAITRSKSVAASTVSPFAGGGGVQEARSVKSKGWYFTSPLKVFRPFAKIVHQRSPLHRG